MRLVAFGGGARYGQRGRVFTALLRCLAAEGISLDPMDECRMCAYSQWQAYGQHFVSLSSSELLLAGWSVGIFCALHLATQLELLGIKCHVLSLDSRVASPFRSLDTCRCVAQESCKAFRLTADVTEFVAPLLPLLVKGQDASRRFGQLELRSRQQLLAAVKPCEQLDATHFN